MDGYTRSNGVGAGRAERIDPRNGVSMPIEECEVSYVKHGAEQLVRPWSGGWMQPRRVMDDGP